MTEQNPCGPPPVDHGIVDAFERIDREHRWTLAEMAGFVKRTEEDPYEWPAVDLAQHIEAIEANARFFANYSVVRRPVEYDDSYLKDMGFINAQDLPGMWDDSDFMGGIEEIRGPATTWGESSVTLEMRNVRIETLELLFGQGLIPLCSREIPTEGQE